MTERSDLHNKLTNEFVHGALRQVLKAGGGSGDAMVLLESLILSFMLIGTKAFSMSPQVSAGLVEEAVHRATERFAQETEEGQ